MEPNRLQHKKDNKRKNQNVRAIKIPKYMELDYKVHNVTVSNLGREASDLSVCATHNFYAKRTCSKKKLEKQKLNRIENPNVTVSRSRTHVMRPSLIRLASRKSRKILLR